MECIDTILFDNFKQLTHLEKKQVLEYIKQKETISLFEKKQKKAMWTEVATLPECLGYKCIARR